MRVHGGTRANRPGCRGRYTKDQICQLLTSPGLGRESSERNWLTPARTGGVGCCSLRAGEAAEDVVAEREETDR